MPFGPMPAEGPSGFASPPEPPSSPATHANGAPATPAAGPSVTMRVHPDRVLALKRDLEAVRNKVSNFLQSRSSDLIVPPMAGDPVSKRASEAFSQNAKTAIQITNQFLQELTQQINSLEKAAKQYNLTEEVNRSTFDKRS